MTLLRTDLDCMADGIDAVLREMAAGYVTRVERNEASGVHSFILKLSSYNMWARVLAAARALELATGRPVTFGHANQRPMIRIADDAHDAHPGVSLDDLLRLPPDHIEDTAVPLGIKPDGGPLWLEIGSNRSNILICGQPGSGKTWLTHSIILALSRRLTPKRLRFVLLDPKRHNLTPLVSGISPFVEYVAQDSAMIAAVLNTVAVDVMQARSYERETVIVLDEFLEVLGSCDGAERAIATIMRGGREYGYRFIACSQAGGIGALAGSLSGLWSMRVVGRMDNAKSAYDAAGISDSGAEKLTGAGDFLAVHDGVATRFRACVPPVTYASGPSAGPVVVRELEPEPEPEPTAQGADQTMETPVIEVEDRERDFAVYRKLTEKYGQPPSKTKWANTRFAGRWQTPFSYPRIEWMTERYEFVRSTLSATSGGALPAEQSTSQSDGESA